MPSSCSAPDTHSGGVSPRQCCVDVISISSAVPAAPFQKRKENLCGRSIPRYCSSQTSARSWPMKWLGVICQPFSFADVTTIRFHHNSGTV